MPRTCLPLLTASLLLATFSILLIPSAVAEIETKSCSIQIPDWFDVDTLQVTEYSENCDLNLAYTMNSETFLIPVSGAQAASLGVVDFDTVVNCSLYQLSADHIEVRRTFYNYTIPTGTVLVIKTDMGNYAKMRIDNFTEGSLPKLDVTIAYQNDGTPIVPEFTISLLAPLLLLTLFSTATIRARSKKV